MNAAGRRPACRAPFPKARSGSAGCAKKKKGGPIGPPSPTQLSVEGLKKNQRCVHQLQRSLQPRRVRLPDRLPLLSRQPCHPAARHPSGRQSPSHPDAPRRPPACSRRPSFHPRSASRCKPTDRVAGTHVIACDHYSYSKLLYSVTVDRSEERKHSQPIKRNKSSRLHAIVFCVTAEQTPKASSPITRPRRKTPRGGKR